MHPQQLAFDSVACIEPIKGTEMASRQAQRASFTDENTRLTAGCYMTCKIALDESLLTSVSVIASSLIIFILFFSVVPSSTRAAVTTSITPTTSAGNLDTTVTQNGNVYNITDGTRTGTNLFHSFEHFSVGSGDIANFQNTLVNGAFPHTDNILGRVTGGNPSNIFGNIQTTDFGNANLFLMNPAGFLFGPNTTVNVGGMLAFTSADYLRLANGARFNAVPNAAADALLSTRPVAAYGFLGSNPGAITVLGSQFAATEGTGISLVGGKISIQSGTPDGGTAQPARLSAPNGKIQLAGAVSPGEFDAATLQALTNTDGASFTSFGAVTLAPDSNINISGTDTVSIRGGQFVLSVNEAVLTAAHTTAPPETVSLSPGSSIISSNGGTDPGADLQIIASNLQMNRAYLMSSTTGMGTGGNIAVSVNTASLMSGAQIVSSSQGTGTGGAVTLTGTGSIYIAGIDPENRPDGVITDLGLIASGIHSTTNGGKGGPITITTPLLVLSDTGYLTTLSSGSGDGGDISIQVPELILRNGSRIFSASGIDFRSFSIGGTGVGGNIIVSDSESITLSGQDALGNPSRIRTETWGGGIGGTIQIDSPQSSLSLSDRAAIETVSLGEAAAGNIEIDSSTLKIAGGAGIGTSGSDIASSGNLDITAHTGIFLFGSFNSNTPSRIVNENQGFGGTGTTTISTDALSLNNGARILSDTFFGVGDPTIPNITITADSVTLSNGSRIDVRNILSDVGALSISSPTISLANQSSISTLTAADGNAGPINLWTNNFSLSGGSQMTSSTSGAGNGGKITIQGFGGEATSVKSFVVTGQDSTGNASGIFTTTTVSGKGGDIDIAAQSFTIQNGGTLSAETSGTATTAIGGTITVDAQNNVAMNSASITTSSTGPGNAGNIHITTGNQFTMTDSTVTTEATQSGGGAIKITTNPTGTVQLTNSTISASVLDGTGGGGSVNIDPQFVILVNSQILATAIQGAGGNIFITTNLLLPDGNSLISASSQFGQNGTVTIQSPNAPISGQIHPLGKTPLLATSLLNQQCASVAGGQFSSFTVAGRNSLPTEPGSWLASPLAMPGTGQGIQTEGGKADGERPDRQMLSLRQIAPAGFLTQAFAVDRSAGCTS